MGNGLTIGGNNQLAVYGSSLSNAGTLTLGGGGYGWLQIQNNVSLSGGGTVNLAGSSYLRGAGTTLTNVDNTIQGYGQVAIPTTLLIHKKD